PSTLPRVPHSPVAAVYFHDRMLASLSGHTSWTCQPDQFTSWKRFPFSVVCHVSAIRPPTDESLAHSDNL
ncbi:Hypothetical predicted protein, partial [Marmota monax]